MLLDFPSLERIVKIQIYKRKTCIMLKYCFSVFDPPQNASQLAFTCSNLTIETLEQGVKYV